MTERLLAEMNNVQDPGNHHAKVHKACVVKITKTLSTVERIQYTFSQNLQNLSERLNTGAS